MLLLDSEEEHSVVIMHAIPTTCTCTTNARSNIHTISLYCHTTSILNDVHTVCHGVMCIHGMVRGACMRMCMYVYVCACVVPFDTEVHDAGRMATDQQLQPTEAHQQPQCNTVNKHINTTLSTPACSNNIQQHQSNVVSNDERLITVHSVQCLQQLVRCLMRARCL